MNKKYFLCWLIVFVAWFLGSFLVHGLLLGDQYGSLLTLYRPEEQQQQLFGFMVLGHIMLAGAFTWIYARGREDRPWAGQGLRYGAAIACLAVIPTYMIYYVVQPIPGELAIKQSVFESALVLVLGLLVAFLYRNKEA